MHKFLPFFLIASITSSIANAKDVVPVHAVKLQSMPVGVIDAYNPDVVSYNKEFINARPQAQNIFDIVDGNHSVEYQRNLQDFGGHTGISINQLPFYYTSTFVDGIYVPDNFLDNAQLFSTVSTQGLKISRGASSTGVQPSSLAGAVNVETIDALQNSITGKVTAGSYGFMSIEAGQTHKISENSGVALTASYNGQKHIDENNDNIAESPKVRNFHSMISHQTRRDNIKIKTRFDVSKNKRYGGSTIVNKTDTTGNPFNFQNAGSLIPNGWVHDGNNEIYDNGAAGILEIIDTTRTSIVSSAESDKFIGGGTASFLKRENFYSGNGYNADETNFFLTGARKFVAGNTKIKLGGDYQYQKLSSEITNTGSIDNPDGYTYSTVALFGDASYEKNRTALGTSSRLMYHNEFGFIGTLKGQAHYHHTNNITSTLSAGNGYYVPTSSLEQNHALITERIDTFKRDVEKVTNVLNASYNTAFSYDNFQINLNYNFNEVRNISALHIDDHDASFETLDGKYTVHGIGFDGSYFFTPTFLATFAAERYWHDLSKLEEGFVMLSRPQYKLFAGLTKRFEKSTARFKATYFGKQDLERFYGHVYNLAGNENPRFAPNFLIIDADFSHKITQNTKLFLGIENITNYVQVTRSPQIALREEEHSGHEPHLDNVSSWGPVRGRFYYVGVQVNL
jgi:outer membrane receptor for ferrienterochelin and colicins